MAEQIEPNILTIDLGTSGPKVGLFNTRGSALGYEFEPVSLTLVPEGGAEQDPDDWWKAIVAATHRLLALELAPRDSIVALSCTTQWSGTVAIDRTGNPLMKAIIWMDARGAPYVKKLTGGLVKLGGYAIHKLIPWVRLSGGAPGLAGKDPLGHIHFIKNQHPNIYQRTYKFLEPKDYLNLRLTGEIAASYDSIALHFLTDIRNLRQVDYVERLLRIADLSGEKFPQLKRAVDILGTLKPEAAQELGLSPDVKVLVGTPDVHSAAIGSGAVADFQAHLYIGTSSWLSCHLPFKKTSLVSGIAALPSAIPDRYLTLNEQECAGACLEYLRDRILYPQDDLSSEKPPEDFFQRISQLAGAAPAGCEGLIFTPWLYGERTPVDDHLVRGGFFNQSLSTTRAHMVRAVYEGVAYNSRWLLQSVEKLAGKPFTTVNMVGGGAQSDLWCQIHADVLNRTIHQMKDPILVNLRGAAFLASVSLGYLSFEDIPNCVAIERTYQPNLENRTGYDQLFAEFLNLYRRNRSIYARLNRDPV